MLKSVAFAIGFIALSTLSTAAYAKCEVKGATFIWGIDDDVTIYTGKNERCGFGLRMRGSFVDSNTITVAPKNGAAQATGLTNVVYMPKPGFIGTDSFKVVAVGSDNRSHGPVTFNVTVIVQ